MGETSLQVETPLQALLARRRPVLLDGAVGTELARRGIATRLPLWSAHSLLDDDGRRVLTEIHADYARAGAEILVTNTFRTTRRALARAGAAEMWRLVNQRAVECAREGIALARRGVDVGRARIGDARAGGAPSLTGAARTCLVAGGIAPLEDCYRPDLVPDQKSCLAEHRQQVTLLSELGVDLIFIETMNSAREAEAALLAARDSGLDILLSLCPKASVHLLSGEPLAEAVPRLVDAGGDRLRGILLNCATPEALDGIFPRFAAVAGGLPAGLYAHLGEPDDVTGWRLPKHHDPGAYAAWVSRRLDEGARLVGGCCGTNPDHIEALSRLLAERCGR